MGTFKGKKAGSKTGRPRVSAVAKAAAAAEPDTDHGEEFEKGTFRIGFVDCHVADNGALCFKFEGRGDDEEIGERIQWMSTVGKSIHVTAKRVKTLAMALLGMGRDQAEEYNEFDPHGEFLNTLMPADLDAAAEYLAANSDVGSVKAARKALDSAEFLIKVTLGSEKDNGGHFMNATFSVVEEGADDEDEDDDEDDAPPARSKKKASKVAPKPSRKSRDEDADDEDADDEDADDEDADDEDEDIDNDPPESDRRPSKKKKTRARR